MNDRLTDEDPQFTIINLDKDLPLTCNQSLNQSIINQSADNFCIVTHPFLHTQRLDESSAV